MVNNLKLKRLKKNYHKLKRQLLVIYHDLFKGIGKKTAQSIVNKLGEML